MQFSDFEILTTADGSPSLMPKGSEPMHSSKGAFSETLYIYGHGIQQSYQLTDSTNTLSVGLGLGYNELLWASFCISKKINNSFLYSFESVPYLSNSFIKWLGDSPNELTNTYDKILNLFSEEFKVEPEVIKAFLKSQHNNNFFIHSSLTSTNNTSKKFNCIFYDAYSSSTSPDLWEEPFLLEFISNYTDSTCVLSTYAATSRLTKSLAQQGFQVKKRKGFGFKRESTFSIKQGQI